MCSIQFVCTAWCVIWPTISKKRHSMLNLQALKFSFWGPRNRGNTVNPYFVTHGVFAIKTHYCLMTMGATQRHECRVLPLVSIPLVERVLKGWQYQKQGPIRTRNYKNCIKSGLTPNFSWKYIEHGINIYLQHICWWDA